jgi:hypothetical protein
MDKNTFFHMQAFSRVLFGVKPFFLIKAHLDLKIIKLYYNIVIKS